MLPVTGALISAVVGVILGAVMAKRVRLPTLLLVWAALVATIAGLLLWGQNQPGFAGLGAAVLGYFVIGPVVVAGILSGIVTLLIRRRGRVVPGSEQ